MLHTVPETFKRTWVQFGPQNVRGMQSLYFGKTFSHNKFMAENETIRVWLSGGCSAICVGRGVFGMSIGGQDYLGNWRAICVGKVGCWGG